MFIEAINVLVFWTISSIGWLGVTLFLLFTCFQLFPAQVKKIVDLLNKEY